MAGSAAVVGALSVILGGDSSALDKVLAGAASNVDSFAKRVTGIAGGISLEKLVSGAVSSVTDTIKKGLDDVTALAKLSEQTGTSVEQLSKLKYAADLADVSSDTLGKSLQSLAGGLTSLASGAVTPSAQALQAMGISAKNTDGTLKTATQTIAEIADKFQSYKDGAAKATLAQQLFGAGGEAMIPLLNKGSKGLSDLGDEAQKFGLIINGDTAASIKSYNENLKKMDEIKEGLAITVVSRLMPSLEQLSGAYLGVKESSTLTAMAADAITKAIQFLVGEVAIATLQFRNAGKELQAFWAFMNAPDWPSTVAAWKQWGAVVDENEKSLAGLKSTLDNVLTGIAGFTSRFNAVFDNDIKKAAASVDEFSAAMEAAYKVLLKPPPTTDASNALTTFLARTTKSTEAVEAQAASVGNGADALARLKVQLEADAVAKTNNIKITDDYRAKIDAAANAAAEAAQKLQAANLTQENLAPQAQRNQLLQQYVNLLQTGKISYDTFSAAALKVQFPAFTSAARSAQDFQAQVDQLSTNLVNGLASAFAQVATGQKSAAEAFGAFALQFVTQMIEMIAKAILFKIIMTAIGFAGGGPVSVPGLSLTGTGGLYDEGGYTGDGGKFVPAGIVHKGEDVFSQDDVARWGGIGNVERLRLGGPSALQSMASFAGGGAVSLPGPSVPQVMQGVAQPMIVQMNGKVFTRDMLADLIDGINGMTRNGYRLQVA